MSYPTTTSSSDVWSLRDQYKARAGDNWPIVTPPPFLANSVLFNGSGYLKTDSSADFAFGTGNFTMEAWIYPNTVVGTQGVVSTRIDASASDAQVFFGLSGSQVLIFPGVSGGTISAGVWTHIAASRSAGTQRIFVNGTQVGSVANTGDKTTTFGYVGAGGGDAAQLFSGYVSNARIVKGVALYTGTFSVPTSPLSTTAQTSLLTCQAPDPFADNSGKGRTVNQFGGVTAEQLSPF